MDSAHAIWPDLTYSTWRETAVTLQLWTQIVGKVRLALTPWVNHSWQVPLYVTARGLGTSPIPIGAEIFEIELDFIGHRLPCRVALNLEIRASSTNSLHLIVRRILAFVSRLQQF